MEFLDQILIWLATAMGASATIGIIFEFIFRFIKTKKPLSWLHLAATFMHKISKVVERLANLLDKILPQRTEEG